MASNLLQCQSARTLPVKLTPLRVPLPPPPPLKPDQIKTAVESIIVVFVTKPPGGRAGMEHVGEMAFGLAPPLPPPQGPQHASWPRALRTRRLAQRARRGLTAVWRAPVMVTLTLMAFMAARRQFLKSTLVSVIEPVPSKKRHMRAPLGEVAKVAWKQVGACTGQTLGSQDISEPIPHRNQRQETVTKPSPSPPSDHLPSRTKLLCVRGACDMVGRAGTCAAAERGRRCSGVLASDKRGGLGQLRA